MQVLVPNKAVQLPRLPDSVSELIDRLMPEPASTERQTLTASSYGKQAIRRRRFQLGHRLQFWNWGRT